MKVSVIITCHNYARFLSRAIRSALNQTFDKDKYEIIVVDDASTDETQKVMSSYSGLIRPIIFKNNVGLSKARNEGIRIALGRFVVNLDADDYFDENILSVESLYLSLNPSWDAVSCDYIIVDDKEAHITRVDGSKNPIACGIMFRKEQLINIGLYDPSFRLREEEDLRIRFNKQYKIKHIELPLYRYRKHGKNKSENHIEMERYYHMLKHKHD